MAISAQELSQLQADLQAQVCDKTCIIQRETSSTPDGIGSSAPTFTAITTTVAGVTLPTANDLQNFAFEIGDKATFKVHVPYGTNVKALDHLLIESQTLEVHILLDPHSVPGLLPLLVVEIK